MTPVFAPGAAGGRTVTRAGSRGRTKPTGGKGVRHGARGVIIRPWLAAHRRAPSLPAPPSRHPPASANATAIVSLCTSRLIYVIALSKTRLLCIRLGSSAPATHRCSLLCSRSRESDAIDRPSGEIAVGKNRPELRRAGSGARDDGRSGSYPRVGYRLPCLRLGAFLGLEDGRRAQGSAT
jgi:hypothetical protein